VLPATRSEDILSEKKNDEVGPDALASKLEALGIPRLTRHIFLCCDQTEPKCCDRTESLAAWEFLKRRLSEIGLSGRGGVYRTKAQLLARVSGRADRRRLPRRNVVPWL
jgi:hypothetical protein